MKKLLLLSLFSVFGIVANRPHTQQIQDEFRKTSSEARTAHNAFLKAKEELRATADGAPYYSARKNWFDCDALHGHGSSACSKMQQDLERGLVQVCATPAGQEYIA